MQDANRDAGASHCVDCGYGAFCKRSPDILCWKSALSGVLRGTIINGWAEPRVVAKRQSTAWRV